MELIYIGDPMCSWCYGFGKEMTEVQARHPELPVRIVVGGLRAGATDVLDDAGKRFRLQHWARVEQASGLPFNRDALMARQGFVYDTEPICRAVVTARRLAPEADLLAVFRALQHAFYVDGLVTTDGEVLAQAATAALAKQGQQIDVAAFVAEWASQDAIDEAAGDFRTARSWGINSFPALALRNGNELYEVVGGYASADAIDAALQRVVAKISATA